MVKLEFDLPCSGYGTPFKDLEYIIKKGLALPEVTGSSSGLTLDDIIPQIVPSFYKTYMTSYNKKNKEDKMHCRLSRYRTKYRKRGMICY